MVVDSWVYVAAALYLFGGAFPVSVLVLIIGLILAAVVWFTSTHDNPPVYHPVRYTSYSHVC